MVDEGVARELETGTFEVVDPATGEYRAVDPDTGEFAALDPLRRAALADRVAAVTSLLRMLYTRGKGKRLYWACRLAFGKDRRRGRLSRPW